MSGASVMYVPAIGIVISLHQAMAADRGIYVWFLQIRSVIKKYLILPQDFCVLAVFLLMHGQAMTPRTAPAKGT